VTINYLELVQFYILSHTVMPKSYLSGTAKRSARGERAVRPPKCRKCQHFWSLQIASTLLPMTTELHGI